MRPTVLLLLFSAAACDAPWAVSMETSIVPPAVYRTWFAEVADCVAGEVDSREGRYERIEWYTATDIYHEEATTHAVGLWVAPHKVVIRSDHLDRAFVVKHEIVHDLLGTGGHGSDRFRACAGV
jgi:hypothetical protein